MNRLGRFNVLTVVVVAALGLCALLDAVGAVSDVSYRNMIERALAGVQIPLDQANAADHRQHMIGLWQIGAFVATGVVFLVWFRRAYSNVGLLGVDGLRYGSRWAVGAWFVPFLNLVRPKVIANDIWRGSDPNLAPEATVGLSSRVPWYFNVWWAALIVSGIVARVAFSSTQSAQTLTGLRTSTTMQLASDGIDLVAAVAAIAVVVEIFRRQRARASSTEIAL